jgi:hypothetical protein
VGRGRFGGLNAFSVKRVTVWLMDGFDAQLSDLVACGPVTLSTAELTDPRAFKHRDHPLTHHTEVFTAMAGPSSGDTAWELQDRVWRYLVATVLVPELPVPVKLAAGSYNSAYAHLVDGLTNNERSLDFHSAVVPAETVAAAFTAAAAGTLPAEELPVTRRSTVRDGLGALVGRQVTVTFAGPTGELTGCLVAVHPDAIVVLSEESIVVVPLGALAYLSSWQLTADEWELFLDN